MLVYIFNTFSQINILKSEYCNKAILRYVFFLILFSLVKYSSSKNILLFIRKNIKQLTMVLLLFIFRLRWLQEKKHE